MQKHYSKDERAGDVTYAGFWVRLAAYLVDRLILFVALLLVRFILSGVMSALKDTFLGGNILFQYNLKDMVLYMLGAVYFILFTYYTGTTLGKRLFHLRVVCEDGNEELRLFSMIYRETVGRYLSGAICALGYFLIVADKEKRGLHDILSDTRVIYARKVRVYEKKVSFTEAEPCEPCAQEKQEDTTLKSTVTDAERIDLGYTKPEMESETVVMPWETAYTASENETERDS